MALAAFSSLPAYGQQSAPNTSKPNVAATHRDANAAPANGPDAAPAKPASADSMDMRRALKDIEKLHRQRKSAQQIADDIAEHGRAFEVTPNIVRRLRALGLRPDQILAVKEASTEPLVPGKSLTTSDAERDTSLEEIKRVVARSHAAVAPIASQHVTLWAAKATQQTYLPDVLKLERFFHTKCAEPIRSGLDKRSTHIILLKDHAEYKAWCQAMFDLYGERFDEKDNAGANAHYREVVLQGPVFEGEDFLRDFAGRAKVRLGAP